MQTIAVYIIFALAIAYAGWKSYKSLTYKAKPGCSKCEASGNIVPEKANRQKPDTL